MEQDYYGILDIDKKASNDKITKQYRKLAKKWHPDRNLDNKEEAENTFKKISQAYEVLLDPKKRQIYDQYGEKGLKEGHSNHMNPEDILNNMFPGGHNDEPEVPDVICELELTYEQMYNGCNIRQEIERASICDKCFGAGTKDGNTIECKNCNGQGQKLTMIGPGMFTRETCKKCRGSGKKANEENECKKCHGMQFRKEFVELDVTVPKGVFEDYPIVMEEEGHAFTMEDSCKVGKKRSNLVFIVKEESHQVFKRYILQEKGRIDMTDLGIELEISFGESIVGFNKTINHLNDKPLDITIPKPCRHGDTFVLKGHGMPDINEEDKYGDLFVTIHVEHPSNLELGEENIKSLCKIFDVNLLPKSKTITKMMPLDKYKANVKTQMNNDHMKQKYEKRKNGNGHGHGHGPGHGPHIGADAGCQQM